MEGHDLEERPHKKRRFFAEDSSPVVQSIQHYSPVATPEPSHGDATSPIDIPSDAEGAQNHATSDGFDVGLLQAVVGELQPDVLQKLKSSSGGDVQRGTA
jgi:DNA repair protein RAD5